MEPSTGNKKKKKKKGCSAIKNKLYLKLSYVLVACKVDLVGEKMCKPVGKLKTIFISVVT